MPKALKTWLLVVAAVLSLVVANQVVLRWKGAPPSLVGLLLTGRSLPAPSSDVAVGHTLPEFQLSDEAGNAVSTRSLLGHPSIFIFYRGALCVACRAQLSALGVHAASFIAQGVRVFGVSGDPPAVSRDLRSTLRLPFPILSDERQTVVAELCNGRVHCMIVTDEKNTVRWGALNDYWRGAASPEAVLVAAYRLEQP